MINSKIVKLLLAVFSVAVLASGCSVYDRETCPADGAHRVMLDIVIPSASPATRADGTPDGPWSGDYTYEDGDEYDNYIDLDNLQILFYKADGATDGATYVAALADYDIVEITGSGKYETNHAYRINGEMKTAEKQTLEAGTYKVMVLANCPKVTSNTTLANLQVTNFFAEGTYIPMWGMKEMAFSFENGKVDDLGKISLLRATAKLNVKLDFNDRFKNERTAEELAAIELESVELLWGATAVNCLPTVSSIAALTNTEEVQQEGGFNPAGTAAAYSPVKAFTLNEDKDAGTLVVPEYTIGNKPAGVASDATAVMKIVIKDGSGSKTFYLDPTANLKKGENDTAGPGKFVRNHSYWFNIVYYADGNLYVWVEVADWIDAPVLNYEMKMNTNMRLFDSWLYRYDTVDQDYTNWSNWAGSHMVVSEGRVTTATVAEPVAGRPTRSPQIQLVTTGVTGSTFSLTVDNPDFEIIQAVKDNDGKVTAYTPSTNGVLTIPAGDDVYTYFYVVPKAGVTPADPRAIVTLIYNDPVLGPQKVTFNYNSLPGYSDDSSEIWVYYVPAAEYTITGKLRMYFQDYNNPLVPTPVQS
jgi:hypothetical protein